MLSVLDSRDQITDSRKQEGYGSSSSLAVGEGVPGCLAGDFAGGGLVGAVDCFLEGGLPTVRHLRIFSSFLGPMPLMERRSSTLLKAPQDSRGARIFCAVEGPMPGTCWRLEEFAVLMLIGWAGGFFLARTGQGRTDRPKTAKKNAGNLSEGAAIAGRA